MTIIPTPALDAAIERVKKTGASKASQSIENQYGQTYQVLVKQGVKPQLRRKYRGQ